MKTAFLIVLALAVLGAIALQAWIRLSAVDPARWHTAIEVPEDAPGDWPMQNGHRAVFDLAETPQTVWSRVETHLLSLPRTRVLVGEAGTGRMTFVTRTAFWGFPDFTTVEVLPREGGARVRVFARQGIGQYDWGVNRARVEGLQEALTASN
ncbi:DUF1499 domain-containing protein [Ovoidimarina sediminis]|uniref:DUF1499 domain-containing protein n=1 Tax=Ovoidimarina sediminis TaxID=3079856 RepID=UPI00290AE0F1|nr:DUF1499 domain-containing protein [Rhodophyticola sp. MJ-SS7]MDU8945662.1 DUF1499 domain-containing protein [Rhodophyticola sp. MJ-SS7]